MGAIWSDSANAANRLLSVLGVGAAAGSTWIDSGSWRLSLPDSDGAWVWLCDVSDASDPLVTRRSSLDVSSMIQMSHPSSSGQGRKISHSATPSSNSSSRVRYLTSPQQSAWGLNSTLM